MPAPTRITDLSATASSNSPSGSEAIGTSLDDYLRAIQAVVKGDLAGKGADIASASTTDLGVVSGLFNDITGVTTITSFGTVAAGVWKIIKFEGSLTLTHNATSLILPSGQNIQTKDGDVAILVSEGSGNWRCVSYQSLRPTFSANKNATDQTGITGTTKVTFGTEDWDVGSYFASSTWTPPAGKYRISASIGLTTGVTDLTAYGCVLYKNGASHRQLDVSAASGTANFNLSGSCIVDANGTDTFEIYSTGGSSLTISGATASTWFQGEQL